MISPTFRPPPGRRVWPVTAALMVAMSSACDSADRTTAPASPQAGEIDGLWTLSLWLGTAVWLAVMVLLAIPLVRSRRQRQQEAEASPRPDGVVASPDGGEADRSGWAAPGAIIDEPIAAADPATHEAAQADERVRSRLLWIGGIIGPAIILLLLLVASGRVGASTAHVERPDEIVIDVTGHMFWWEVHYPDHDVTTANEIHVPVDRPVRLRLYSEDVIHSFWIPRMHGKIDTIPGQENWLSFEPTETGTFRGACAEFCGIAHAQMVAWLEVQPVEDFDAWIEQQAADATPPEDDAAQMGERVFIEAGCAACHAVRGTEAVGGVGPDLTHLASRQTLASGIVPNDRDNLQELIVDPLAVKPGIRMPPTQLSPEEIEALLDYLETLE